MAKKNFSAGSTKSGVLNNDGGEKLREIQAKTQYNFKYIPKDKIIPNPKNEQYTQDGIEALKESILVNGLRHNLSVLYDAETDQYRLISGERRYHAICQMTDKEYRDNFPAGIPCKVEKSDISDIDEEIMLISANHDVRESSMEVKRWEVSRLLELYEAKKLKGEIKNIHAEIASQLNISERQARKYTTAEKLIPELSELLNSNGIDLNQADKFGKLDEGAQKTILSIIQKNGTIENAEFQSIKKLSEERADEARQYKKQLDSATKEIEDKKHTIELLEQRINDFQSNSDSTEKEPDKDEMVKFAMQAKEKAEPEALKYIKRFYGAKEFLHNEKRWCLWLESASPKELKSMPMIMARIDATRKFRLESSKLATQKYANYPTRFMEMRQPSTSYILVPRHTSENRRYIPFGFMEESAICGDANSMIPHSSLYHFGILISNVHMAWVRAVCGRIKSDYRYSNDVVYNNFPWPAPTDEQKAKIEQTAQAILDARNLYPNDSLADLYDERTMPPELRRAHQQNDKAVMQAYGFSIRDTTESTCVAALMKMYQQLVQAEK